MADKQNFYDALVAVYAGTLPVSIFENLICPNVPPEWVRESLRLHIDARKREGHTLPPFPSTSSS